jgi:hypothetical protein
MVGITRKEGNSNWKAGIKVLMQIRNNLAAAILLNV